MSEVKVDTISERTTDAGVTIEGVKVEDGVATFQTAAGSPLVFEGATADAFETTFSITDPTADRTITFPDASITLSAGGGLLGLVKYTGDGTYTPGGVANGTAGDEGNADVTKVIIEVQAGGGGGGEGAGTTYNVGGSAGGYAKKFIDVSAMKAAAPVETAAITVGGGGAGTSVTGAAGADGEDSTWVYTGSAQAALTVTGVKGVGNYSNYGTAIGGLATGGDINIQGGIGGCCVGKSGGDSMFGFGGQNGSTGNSIATVGSGYGSGGGGYYGGDSKAGAGGIVIVWEYQ